MLFGVSEGDLFDEESRQYYLKEYGTTNVEKINHMREALEFAYLNTRSENLNLIFGEASSKERFSIFKSILLNRHSIIARDKITFGINKCTLLEQSLIDLDNKILQKQLKKRRYSEEQSKIIINNIRKYNKIYGTGIEYDLLSVNVRDYEIDEKLNVKIKPAKVRYKMLLQQDKIIKEMFEEKNLQ